MRSVSDLAMARFAEQIHVQQMELGKWDEYKEDKRAGFYNHRHEAVVLLVRASLGLHYGLRTDDKLTDYSRLEVGLAETCLCLLDTGYALGVNCNLDPDFVVTAVQEMVPMNNFERFDHVTAGMFTPNMNHAIRNGLHRTVALSTLFKINKLRLIMNEALKYQKRTWV